MDIGVTEFSDEALLVGRVMLSLLFVLSGWGKLTDFHDAVAYMTQTGAPIPFLSAAIAVAIELVVGLALMLGILTRPVAILLALYTLVTAFIGHHYWTRTGLRSDNLVHFYKNFSIVGALLVLYVTGAGRYAVDTRVRAPRRGPSAASSISRG
jgi:putative oxidoreductase